VTVSRAYDRGARPPRGAGTRDWRTVDSSEASSRITRLGRIVPAVVDVGERVGEDVGLRRQLDHRQQVLDVGRERRARRWRAGCDSATRRAARAARTVPPQSIGWVSAMATGEVLRRVDRDVAGRASSRPPPRRARRRHARLGTGAEVEQVEELEHDHRAWRAGRR
jgi:hypothetical protein